MFFSAAKFEVAPVLSMLDKHQISYSYFEFGVGPINAAKSSVQLKEVVNNKNVIYLGSAGTFSSFDKPYLCKVNNVLWLPTAERMCLAKHMESLYQPLKIVDTHHFDLPIKRVLTSTSVSLVNDICLDSVSERHQLVENMEAYALLMELIDSTKNLDLILGITNGVGPKGSEQWATYFMQIAQMTADYLEDNIMLLKELSST